MALLFIFFDLKSVSTPPGGGKGGGVVTYSDVINIGLPFGKDGLGFIRPLEYQVKGTSLPQFTLHRNLCSHIVGKLLT